MHTGRIPLTSWITISMSFIIPFYGFREGNLFLTSEVLFSIRFWSHLYIDSLTNTRSTNYLFMNDDIKSSDAHFDS